jgi:ribosome-binding protein aMBF1 (putative translation factor)
MEDNPLSTNQARKLRKAGLTAEPKARVEASHARHRSPAARADEAAARDAIEREYRETGTLKTAGDGTTMGDLVAFCRFVVSLRQERERIGLSLNDVAERAKIDKAALSRLESGQQLNPTVGTLTRYARALGKCLTWGLSDAE